MTRHAHCIFCDDIRQEVGHKHTYVGVYNGELYLPMAPIVLAKLCVSSFATAQASEPIKALSMRVEVDEQNIGQVDVPAEELTKLTAAATSRGTQNDPVESYSVGVNTMYVPFGVHGPCTVKVTMIIDGVEHIAGKLRIKIEADTHEHSDKQAQQSDHAA